MPYNSDMIGVMCNRTMRQLGSNVLAPSMNKLNPLVSKEKTKNTLKKDGCPLKNYKQKEYFGYVFHEKVYSVTMKATWMSLPSSNDSSPSPYSFPALKGRKSGIM